MQNDIKTLRIQNFKSIKDVTMTPRRVNLIIGMPNVGKSNILEAMSLLGGGGIGGIECYIRFEKINQVFYDNLLRNRIKIETDKQFVFWGLNSNSDSIERLFILKKAFINLRNLAKEKSKEANVAYPFDTEDEWLLQDLKNIVEKDIAETAKALIGPAYYIRTDLEGKSLGSTTFATGHSFGEDPPTYTVQSYVYKKGNRIDKDSYQKALWTPGGDNLMSVIQAFPELRKEIAQMFEPYGQKILIRIDERRLEVVKDLEGIIYSYPYSSIADTLQRIIFYLAAIESNDDAVILLEEPEAHSYPMYVSMLGKRMVESRNNQFFVATHSPYLITEVLEQMLPDEAQAQELAIFVAYYEDYQTKVKQLSDEEVQAIRGDSVDVFYNMARYIPRPADG